MITRLKHVSSMVVGIAVTTAVLLGGAGIVGASTESLTPLEKLADFEYLYSVVSENYPFLWVNERINGIDWLGEKDEFRKLVEAAETDEEFARAIAYILSRLNNDHTHILSSSSAGTVTDDNNVTTSVIDEGRIAYIKIRSFSSRYVEQDRQQVLEFLASVRDYPNLLIDIRGNGGGSEQYWRQLLVAPLISDPVAWRWYVVVRSGAAVQEYMKNRLGPGYYFLQVGRGNLPRLQNVPREVFTEEYIEPIQLPDVIMPKNPVGFTGRIFLLVDERVYSSTETFAAFAKTTGWATLVGTVTGGDGIGFDPMVFTLPNSKLNIRMAESMGLNPDGTANEETKTVPDVLVDTGLDAADRDVVLETAVALCAEEGDRSGGLRGGGSLLSKLDWMWVIASGFGGLDVGLGELAESADFSAYEGMEVESVEVYGAFKTSKSLIKQIVGIKPGDRFSTEAMGLASRRLRLTSAFRSSGLLARPAGEHKVKVVIYVQEGWSLYLGPRDLGRRVVQDILSRQISVSLYNVAGRMLNIRAVYGLEGRSRWSLRVDLPVLAGALPLELSAAVGSQPVAVTLAAGTHLGSSYELNRSIVSLGVRTAMSKSSSLAAQLSHTTGSVTRLRSTTGLSIQSGQYMSLALTFDGQVRRTVPSSYEVTVGMMTDPVSGSAVTHGFATARAVATVRLSDKNALVISGSMGTIDSLAPASQWFLLGGGDAFPEYSRSLLGHSYFSANAELRHSLRGDLSVGVVAGLGKVWDVPGSFGLQGAMTRVGVVARYTTPISLEIEARYTKGIGSDAERFYIGLNEQF
ncbi:MAG: hypothetical protein GXX08_08450 [Firmicutes bacterium]|nr:hypothetical protein [Bacillota bacterium]